MIYLYDAQTGKYLGCNFENEVDLDNVTYTTIQPPARDTLWEELYFIDGEWEIRSL